MSKTDIQGLFTAVEPLLTPAPAGLVRKARSWGLLEKVGPILNAAGKISIVGLTQKTTPKSNSLGGFNLKRLVDRITLVLDAGGLIDFAGLIGHITLALNLVGQIDLESIFDAISPLLSPSPVDGLTRLTILGGVAPVVGAIKRVDIASLRARPLLKTPSQLDLADLVNAFRPFPAAFDRIDIESIVN
ncbi:hypothetical protein DL771_003097 [Monosporascus sp. 5C6A]|nr:hypothetical protein DL771_003097 [Monosporascus sp. 5C6A]